MKKNERPKILIFGNPIVKEDSMPLKLKAKLENRFPDIEFKEFIE